MKKIFLCCIALVSCIAAFASPEDTTYSIDDNGIVYQNVVAHTPVFQVNDLSYDSSDIIRALEYNLQKVYDTVVRMRGFFQLGLFYGDYVVYESNISITPGSPGLPGIEAPKIEIKRIKIVNYFYLIGLIVTILMSMVWYLYSKRYHRSNPKKDTFVQAFFTLLVSCILFGMISIIVSKAISNSVSHYNITDQWIFWTLFLNVLLIFIGLVVAEQSAQRCTMKK